jgi:hypothetical protein
MKLHFRPLGMRPVYVTDEKLSLVPANMEKLAGVKNCRPSSVWVVSKMDTYVFERVDERGFGFCTRFFRASDMKHISFIDAGYPGEYQRDAHAVGEKDASIGELLEFAESHPAAWQGRFEDALVHWKGKED